MTQTQRLTFSIGRNNPYKNIHSQVSGLSLSTRTQLLVKDTISAALNCIHLNKIRAVGEVSQKDHLKVSYIKPKLSA